MDPKPVIISGAKPVSFVAQHAKPLGGPDYAGGAHFNFGDVPFDIDPLHRKYLLTAPGYQPDIFSKLEDFPLPPAVASVDLRPVVSIGLNGTGEKDIAHHFHPVTAMRLLQGRKIWALRPPTDPECAANTGDCTDPFNVCAYYARPRAPAPACVQEAGDTIIVPDGWYHGTCNNASWTVGWGGQGRRLMHLPPRCFHCRLSGGLEGQQPYVTTEEAAVTAFDARAVVEDLSSSRGGRGLPAQGLSLFAVGAASQALYMSIRSLFGQFVVMSAAAQEANAAIREPMCTLVPTSSLSTYSYSNLGRPTDHAHVLLPLQGSPLRLSLRHAASGETERRELAERHAAFWVGLALESAVASEAAGASDLVLYCAAPMPWLSTASPHRR